MPCSKNAVLYLIGFLMAVVFAIVPATPDEDDHGRTLDRTV
jgi:hypothetical protein